MYTNNHQDYLKVESTIYFHIKIHQSIFIFILYSYYSLYPYQAKSGSISKPSQLRPGPIIFRLRVALRMPGVVGHGHPAPAFKERTALEFQGLVASGKVT